jgi:hypothetical protein
VRPINRRDARDDVQGSAGRIARRAERQALVPAHRVGPDSRGLIRSVGLSKSALSQIERERVDSWRRSVASSTPGIHAGPPVRDARGRRQSGRALRSTEGISHRVQPAPLRAVESRSGGQARGVSSRGARSRHGGQAPLNAHEGEEYGIVIRGRVEVFVDGSTYVLGPGDSVFFHATNSALRLNAGQRDGRDDLGHCSTNLLSVHRKRRESGRGSRHGVMLEEEKMS